MCDHLNFIEIVSKVDDRSFVTLNQQKDSTNNPIEKRGFSFSLGKYDNILAQKDGYLPDIPGVGCGDYLTMRICVSCKNIINFPDYTLDKWKEVVNYKEESDCDEESDNECECESQPDSKPES